MSKCGVITIENLTVKLPMFCNGPLKKVLIAAASISFPLDSESSCLNISKTKKKKMPGLVAQACNSSYSGG